MEKNVERIKDEEKRPLERKKLPKWWPLWRKYLPLKKLAGEVRTE